MIFSIQAKITAIITVIILAVSAVNTQQGDYASALVGVGVSAFLYLILVRQIKVATRRKARVQS